jgi:hypothetical protein
MKKILILAIAIVTIAASANAQRVANENNTIKDERIRVAQGVKNGTITKAEAKKIKCEAKDVKKAQRRANADGVVTNREKAKIAKQDRELDATIAKSKNNNRRRG